MEVGSATVDELIEPVAVVDAVTSGDGAAVKTAGEVVSKVIKPLPANVRSQLEVVPAEKSREVVNELVVGLIPLNRKVTCASNARLRRYWSWIEEAEDRSVVSGGDVDERGS